MLMLALYSFVIVPFKECPCFKLILSSDRIYRRCDLVPIEDQFKINCHATRFNSSSFVRNLASDEISSIHDHSSSERLFEIGI